MSVTFSIAEEDGPAGMQVLLIRGDIDLYTMPQLKERLNDALESGRTRLLVDLSDTSFIDSSGLGALIGAHGRARERGGRLALCCGGDAITRTLALTGLDQVLPMLPSREAAMAKLTG